MRRTCMLWKTVKLSALFGALLLMTSASVYAQTEIIDVPFDFTVGNTVLPAGEYLAKRNRIYSDVVWQLQSKNGQASASFMTRAVTATKTQNRTQFIFNSYGNQNFLSQVWIAGNKSGRELPMSRRESELRKNLVARRLVLTNSAR